MFFLKSTLVPFKRHFLRWPSFLLSNIYEFYFRGTVFFWKKKLFVSQFFIHVFTASSWYSKSSAYFTQICSKNDPRAEIYKNNGNCRLHRLVPSSSSSLFCFVWQGGRTRFLADLFSMHLITDCEDDSLPILL